MINLRLLLVDGSILTAVFAVFVVGTIVWKPRMWLHDFPEDIQALAPPKTAEEKHLTMWVAVPWFVILLGGFTIAGMRYGTTNGYWALLLHLYLIWQIINLFDLVILDWAGMHLIDPQNPPFPGTEGAKGYRDYWFHFVGFLKGSVLGVVLVVLVSIPVWIFLSPDARV